MEELKKIEKRIEFLRKCLYQSIDHNETLLVRQVIWMSQELDKALNQYDEAKRKVS